MSDVEYRRTVIAPTLGVDYSLRPHLIRTGKWARLQQMRCFKGLVSEFPGWQSILASGNAGTFGSLLTEFLMEDGVVHLVAGGNNKLYVLNTATLTLTDISGALSFAPTRDYPWSAQVWSNILYLTNKADGLHKWTGSGNVANIATGPDLWNVRVLKNHLCGFGVGTDPMKFQWASEGSETAWTASATNDAGSFRVVESSDRAVTLEPLHEDLVGYKGRSIHIFSYIGGREVVGRRRMVHDVGLLGPYAIALLGDSHIFMGDPPDFYEYDGGSTVDNRVGDDVRSEVFDNLHPILRNRCRTLVLPLTFEVMFAYPDRTAVDNCNKVVVFNYKDRIWYGPFDISRGVSMMGYAKLFYQTVIDSASAVIDTVSDLIDTYLTTQSESKRLFIDSSGNIHEVGVGFTDNGTAIIREAETGDLFLGMEATNTLGELISFPFSTLFNVFQVNIEVEDVSGGNAELSVGSRRDLNDSITWSDAITIKSAATQTVQIPLFGIPPGRWYRLKFRLPASVRLSLAGYQFLFSVAGVR